MNSYYISDYGISFFAKVFCDYWSGFVFPLLILLSEIYILKTKDQFWKKIMVYPIIITLLTVLNPIIMYWIVLKMSWSDRYYRFYWLIPVAFILACSITDILSKLRNGWEKLACSVLVVLILFVLGVRFPVDSKAENIYKISNEVIEISELIHEDSPENQMPLALYDLSLVPVIRQYDASIRSAMDRGECRGLRYFDVNDKVYLDAAKDDKSYLIIGNINYEYNIDKIRRDMHQRGIEYFIRNKWWFSNSYVDKLGFQWIGETENYEVYKCLYETGM